MAPVNVSTGSEGEYTLDDDKAVIFSGIYNSDNPLINFTEYKTGRFFRFTFKNNTKVWKDGYSGRTSINKIKFGSPFYTKKVTPLTNTKIITKTGSWEERRDGDY